MSAELEEIGGGGGVGGVGSIWVSFFLDGMFPLSSCLDVLHLRPIPFDLPPPHHLLLKSLFLYSSQIFRVSGRFLYVIGQTPTWPEPSDICFESKQML